MNLSFRPNPVHRAQRFRPDQIHRSSDSPDHRNLGILEQNSQTLCWATPSVAAPEQLAGWLTHALLLTRQVEAVSVSGWVCSSDLAPVGAVVLA